MNRISLEEAQSIIIEDWAQEVLEAEKRKEANKMNQEDWLNQRLVCKPANREKVEHLLTQIYKHLKWSAFEYIVFKQSPPDYIHARPRGGYYGHRRVHEKLTERIRTLDVIFSTGHVDDRLSPYRDICPLLAFGNRRPLDAISLDSAVDIGTKKTQENILLKDAFTETLKRIKKSTERIPFQDTFDELMEEVLDFYPLAKIPAVLERPVEIHLNQDYRPHSTSGPAVIWRDGRKEWWFNGVRANKRFVEEPPTISYINKQDNAERRRVLIERYGEERYLSDRKAKLIAEDEYGKLFRITNPRNPWTRIRREDEVFIQVTNSTPEPDGSSRKFFIKVPPNTQTPKEGVAWSFELDHKTYKPKVEA